MHFLINSFYLRYPSNIAVYKHRLAFIKRSSKIINFQIVILSGILRFGECVGFFFLYFRYLDKNTEVTRSGIIQIRIAIISGAMYWYMLVL